MDFTEIIGYVGSAIGGGGLTALFNWRYNKKKNAADLKSDEIENMRKAMMDFYEPLVNKQNERIAELEHEVRTLREERRQMELTYQKQIEGLQKQIVEITRALGIKANNRVRDDKTGRYVKKHEG